MKKFLLLFTMLFLFAGFVSSQTVLYEDNLDSYATNSFLAVDNPTWWTTWSNLPGSGEDIQIKTTFSHSAPSSGLCDVTSSVATDGILKLGNKVSGAYELKWWMYIETGKCGYYNIQHMQAPGTEWAFELYFRTDGTFELQEGGNVLNGTYPKATWFECKHEIDLDADIIKLTINGVLVNTWPFSDEASATGGTKQLGGVDFFAGAYSGTTEVPVYYIDDISFSQTAIANDPVIGIDTASMAAWLVGGTATTKDITVSNTGTADLMFDVNIAYDIPAKKSTIIDPVTTNEFTVKRVLSKVIADPTPNPGGPCPATDATGQLHYDGDNANAVGWSSVPISATVAARFTNPMTLPFVGLNITSVEVYINDLNTPPASNVMKLRIYGMSSTIEPGPMIYSQTFTPVAASWNTITLTTPVKVTGEDLWVGYFFTQSTASKFIPGTDGGPADPNGDFVSTGVGWTHISTDANWNIRANLTGDLYPQWLSVTPMMATVAPAANQPLTLGFSTTDLVLGQYTAKIRLFSNDPVTSVVLIPVTLDVVGVGINEVEKIGVMIYPNPVTDKLNIVTNGTINKISVTDLSGKVVFKGNSQSIDISALSKGVYFVKVETAQGISNTKFIKE
jgi:hypothetical protein